MRTNRIAFGVCVVAAAGGLARAAHAGQSFTPVPLHDPPAPPSKTLDCSGCYEGGYYTGKLPYRVGPGLRLSPGGSLALAGGPPVAFVFDAAATGRIGLAPGETQWVLVPELGWTWNGGGPTQFVTAGVGIGRGHGESRPASEARAFFGGISYVPRFVLGVGDAYPAKGLRHGVLWDHDQTTISLEASHEVLWWEGGKVTHAVRASASLDVGRLLWLAIGR